MKPSGWRARVVAVLNLVIALSVVGGLVTLGASGAGPLPPLGPLLNPGTGAWTLAATAHNPTNGTRALPGLSAPVQVTFETNGTAHITASTDADLFRAMGYVQATFRLFQMDLLRRQGEGLLSQVVGKAALSNDEFEVQLGLTRTAQQEWAMLSPGEQAIAREYTEGVNTVIGQEEQAGTLPVLFKALGYQPTPWQPIDSLVIQGVMTQSLDFTSSPLDYALLVKSLGYDRAMRFFPVIPANVQHPYDLGPYTNAGVTPLPTHYDTGAPTTNSQSQPTTSTPVVTDAEALAVSDLKARIAALPPSRLFTYPDSNNWAVNGEKTATGKALMAGDPHLDMTLPAIWYQMDLNSPGYHAAGISIPGTPVLLIGRNQHISWSLTNTQNQATLYYQEQTDSEHPDQYYWNGAWHTMGTLTYDIPIKGASSEHLTVHTTVHGPILTYKGQTVSVWWAGAQPSKDLNVFLQFEQAENWTQFRDALREWYAPSQNFVYADDQGNIGLISAGYYPQVASGQPWLPLPGTGASDVVGTIPFDAMPQVYDPATHYVFSANQREVGPDYPYYIGTSLDFFSDGYRADAIQRALSSGTNLTAADMQRMQNDTHDFLAGLIVPKLLDALQAQPLTPQESSARTLLSGWDDDMSTNSAAATIWMRFWTQYVYDTFQPWWSAKAVPQQSDSALTLAPNRATSMTTILGEDLEAWTVNDPSNAGLALPDGTQRYAPRIMRQAFAEAVAALAKHLGNDPTAWTWGSIHFRAIPSLAQIDGLGYGPVPAPGDERTIDAADGGGNLDGAGVTATAGPSWRLVVDWGQPGGQAYGVYPGGQSENPLSPWYENQISHWWNGQYYPLLSADQAQQASGSATWTLRA